MLEEEVLVSIDGGEEASKTWLSINTKREMNLIYFEDRKVSL